MRSKSEAGDPIRRPYNYSSGSGSEDLPAAAEFDATVDHQHHHDDSIAINIAAEYASDASLELLDRLPHPRAMAMGEKRRRIQVVSSSTTSSSILSVVERHKATLSLAIACLWPVLVLLLLLISRHDVNANINRNVNAVGTDGEYDRMLMSPDGIAQSSITKSRVAVVIVVPSPPPSSLSLSEDQHYMQQTQRAILDNR
jgi:hypothetical protein